MDSMGESSSVVEKPVIVRVKRKVGQSPLDAFWLEINERPFKRPILDLSKLSISDSDEKEGVKLKKVLVRHLETVTESEDTIKTIDSFFESGLNEHCCSKRKFEKRKIAFKKDNRKEQRLTKAVQQQQIAAENARFEQIWRSRKGNKEDIYDKEVNERCHFYDVLRVDTEERQENAAPEVISLEDQKMLASYLPLLREVIPTAAEEIEDDIHFTLTEEYVYDYYAVNEEMDMSEDSSKNHFPLIKVGDDDFYDGPDESDHYDSDDSNAEDHPRNDYPEEISEDEEEEEEDDDEEEEKSEASDKSSEDEETSKRHVIMVLGDDEFDGYEEDWNGYRDSSDDGF